MKKPLCFILFYSLSAMILFAQNNGLQYQSMYIPKSNQQMWNEIVMSHSIVDNNVKNAKINYANGYYQNAINCCEEAQYYGKKYLNEISTVTYYIMGKSYAKLGKERKAKKYLKKARKYGFYSDSQIF